MKFSNRHPYFDYQTHYLFNEHRFKPKLKPEVGEWLDYNAKGLVEVETIYNAAYDEYWARLKFSDFRDAVLFRMFWD